MSKDEKADANVVGASPWGPVVACECGRVAPVGLPVPHRSNCPKTRRTTP